MSARWHRLGSIAILAMRYRNTLASGREQNPDLARIAGSEQISVTSGGGRSLRIQLA